MCHSEGALSGAYRQLEGVVNDHVCIWTLYADIHGVMLLDQVLQQLNVCRISKKRKVKAQFEGKQASLEGLPEQQLPSWHQCLRYCGAVGGDVVQPVTVVA